jgi:hypothetical protein
MAPLWDDASKKRATVKTELAKFAKPIWRQRKSLSRPSHLLDGGCVVPLSQPPGATWRRFTRPENLLILSGRDDGTVGRR